MQLIFFFVNLDFVFSRVTFKQPDDGTRIVLWRWLLKRPSLGFARGRLLNHKHYHYIFTHILQFHSEVIFRGINDKTNVNVVACGWWDWYRSIDVVIVHQSCWTLMIRLCMLWLFRCYKNSNRKYTFLKILNLISEYLIKVLVKNVKYFSNCQLHINCCKF